MGIKYSLLVVVYVGSRKQGKLQTSLCGQFKVNPLTHKKMWNCLLHTQRVVKCIGFLPPAESMFAVQPFSLNNICFIQFGCLTKSSEANRLLGEPGGWGWGVGGSLHWFTQWNGKTQLWGKPPRVTVSVHVDWKKQTFFSGLYFRWLSTSVKSSGSESFSSNGALLSLVHHGYSISDCPACLKDRGEKKVDLNSGSC